MESLKDQGVKNLYRLKSRKFESAEGSTTVKLIFNTKVIPSSVCIAYLKFRISQFVPPVVRCCNCQRYGHFASECKGKLRCTKCGKEHKAQECEVEIKKCVICKGDHSASWNKCPARVEHLVINKVKPKIRVPRREAIEIINKTYAAAVMTPQ